ncbi:MAG: lysylphosphatidylglycerol synthase domain-containing protein [Candidatus Binatia bacterium]|nr:lysylphosphatidylglycerol synthase domain-containing protein [Candidatus Binatia bacterium]
MRWLERGLACLGAALLGGLVYRLGWRDLVANLSLVGWGLLLVLAQEILAFAANTLGWRWAFRRNTSAPRFTELLAARVAGDAFNYVTPTASLGGEFVRLQMLAAAHGRVPLAASLSVAKLAQTLGQVVFILVGLAVVAVYVSLPEAIQWAAWLTLGGFVGVCAGLVWWQRRGMFAPALLALEKFGWLQGPAWRSRILRLDEEIRALHRDGWRFGLSVLAFAVGWALGTVEMYIVLWLLDGSPSWMLALAIEVFSATLDGILFFVPAKLGTQEGGKVLIFSLLGLDPAKGLAAGVLRRVRELFWAAVGLSLWWWKQWGRAGVASAAAR